MSGNKQKPFVCPSDGRHFSTKRALLQHAATHSGPVSAKRAPKPARPPGRVGRNNISTAQLGPNNSRRIVSGVDIIGTFIVTAGMSSGKVLSEAELFPPLWHNTRVAAESGLWSRWRPLKLILEFVSSAGSMTSGSVVAGWTADAESETAAEANVVAAVASMKPSVQSHISKTMRLVIPNATTQKWYMLDHKSDFPDRVHGKWLVALAGTVGNVTAGSSFTYTVRCQYVIEFDSPTMPKTAINRMVTVYATTGWDNYFSDSVSSWMDGKILSAKVKSGGNLAEFAPLKWGIIYALDPSASFNYIKGGRRLRITHATLIWNHSAHMIFFDQVARAREYIRSKDAMRWGIPFEAAGDVVVPSNPAWFEYEDVSSAVTSSSSLEMKIDTLLQMLGAPSTLKVSDSSVSKNLTIGNDLAKRALGVLLDASEEIPVVGRAFNVVGARDTVELNSQAQGSGNDPNSSVASEFEDIDEVAL